MTYTTINTDPEDIYNFEISSKYQLILYVSQDLMGILKNKSAVSGF
jgi:hypothetical protein